jgi:hypothetical protein
MDHENFPQDEQAEHERIRQMAAEFAHSLRTAAKPNKEQFEAQFVDLCRECGVENLDAAMLEFGFLWDSER